MHRSLFKTAHPYAVWVMVGLCGFLAPAALGQDAPSATPEPQAVSRNWKLDGSNWKFSLANPAKLPPSVAIYRLDSAGLHDSNFSFTRPPRISAPDTIEKMEAAFSCNDTPFIDQVRLPVAALWHGRVRLTGFESDVTTANFVLGLPGAGTLANLSLTGSGHLATHAPPSDQLVGMHLTFSIGPAETGTFDNSGLHGIQYLARTGRTFFQTLLDR